MSSAYPGLLDDPVSGPGKDADRANVASKAEVPQGEKKVKKEKEKNVKLVYSDNNISPEEKMARLPRYAFVPEGGKGEVMGDTTTTTS